MMYSIKKLLPLLCFVAGPVCTLAQEQPFNAIKLYVRKDTRGMTALPEDLQGRLFVKITQLINETGIAEEGYGNFYVLPRFDTVGTYVDDAGMGKIYTTECVLTLSVVNTSYSARNHNVTFGTIERKLTGSATRRSEALFKVISSISPGDPELVAFLRETKAKISAYFQQHCEEVITEAQQAERINDFRRAISLYFSVPSDAPAACYQKALAGINRTYSQYVAQDCNQQLLKLKAYVARAQTTDTVKSRTSYDEVMNIVRNLDPASRDCFGEAIKQIEKIEGRFNIQQQQAWEIKKKSVAIDAAEAKRKTRDAAARISVLYLASTQAPVLVPASVPAPAPASSESHP